MSDQAIKPASTGTRGSKPAPADGRDPDVKVPAAVRKAAERSEAILKERSGANDQPAEGNAPEGITIVPQQPAAPQQTTIQQQQPAAPQQSATPQQPAAEPQRGENDFNAMKGRFDRANRDNIRLAEEVTNLRNVIATMQMAPASQPTPSPSPAPTGRPRVTRRSGRTRRSSSAR